MLKGAGPTVYAAARASGLRGVHSFSSGTLQKPEAFPPSLPLALISQATLWGEGPLPVLSKGQEQRPPTCHQPARSMAWSQPQLTQPPFTGVFIF